MKKIRTLVVDDEPLARARIKKLLDQLPYIHLVGECKNGKEALQRIEEFQPDLVFLDIQMPDLNGFEVLTNNKIPNKPFIIFVTAYDQYALQAFDVKAVDYLLKPFDNDRFFDAVEHARQQVGLRQKVSLHEKVLKLIGNYTTDQHTDFVLSIKDRGTTFNIKPEDICYLEAQGNYLKIYLMNRFFLYRQTLHTIEQQLDPAIFKRIHRSYLVNIHFIRKVNYQGNNQYLFRMSNGNELLSSRSHRENINEFIQDL